MRGVPENLAVPGSRDALYGSASLGWNRVESRDAGLRILGVSWTNRHREMGTPNMPDHYRSSSRLSGNPGLAFREVCRSVLNLQTLTFVAANAPSEVVSSFEVHQQRLASFSLQVASKMLVRQLTERRGRPFHGSLSRLFQSSTLKAKNAFLLVACTFGRLSLGVLRALRPGIPRRLQLSVSANILKNVGNLLIDTEIVSKPISDNRSNGSGLY